MFAGATAHPGFRCHRGAAGLILGALFLGACSTLNPPPSPEVREQLGRVAVVAVPSSPSTDFHTFATSKPEGVAKGSAMGAAEGLLQAVASGGSSGGGPYAGAAVAIAALILAVFGAVAGGVAGHHYAVPAADAQQAESHIEQVLGSLDLADSLANRMAQLANSRSDLRSRQLTVADARSASSSREALRDAGVDTMVRIRVAGAGFEGGVGADPAVHLYLSTQLQVVRTSDGVVAYERDFRFAGPDHRLGQWFADDARPLQRGFEDAVAGLAERMLDELFLVTRFPFASGLWAFPGSEEFGACWFRPLYPPNDIKGFGAALRENLRHPTRTGPQASEDMILYETVDSLQPTLRWEGFPRPRDLTPANETVLRTISDVSYDLKVWLAPEGYPQQIIVDRSGLTEPAYRFDQPLAPGSRYFWTFRARYSLDGRAQVSRWAFSSVPANAAGMPPGGSCDLDQIPSTNFYRFATP